MVDDRYADIASQFVHILKVFEDFRFINQLKEEMDKVKVECYFTNFLAKQSLVLFLPPP